MFPFDHRVFLEQDFAIVNPWQVEAALWQSIPAVALGQDEFDCDAGKLPQLLCLREVETLARLELLARAEAFDATEAVPFFSALIRSGDAASALARHFGRQLVLRRASNLQSYFFRYFDPWVFVHLPRILRPDQFHSLLGSSVTWTWFNPIRDQWSEHRSGGDLVRGPGLSGLRLADDQLDAIARIELVNAVWRRLQCEPSGREFAPESLGSIDGWVRQAVESERLTLLDDQVQFAVDAMTAGSPASPRDTPTGSPSTTA